MNLYYLKSVLFLLLFPLAGHHFSSQKINAVQSRGAMGFYNVNLVDVNQNRIISHQNVLVEDGKITAIGKSDQMKFKDGIDVIDANGKFLMPGLAEMHAHIPGINNGLPLVEETLFLYLANGVTTIRGMLGQPYHLELREKVEKGEILGPRIFTSGPSLNGNSVKSLEEAARKVKAQKLAGYDFLKLHPGLTRANFDQIVETANEVGIPYSGHVSVDVGIRRAIEAKYASIDHVDGYLEGLVPLSAGVDPGENGFFGVNFTTLADQNKIRELAKATKASGVWVVPTQRLLERWAGIVNANEIIKEEGMQFMDKNTLGQWVNSKKNFDRLYQLDEKTVSLFIEIRRNIIKALHDEGVGLLLGSDSPQVFNVPGFSIHHELQAMRDAGLTNADALVMGTRNPAMFFGMENVFGTIQTGADADLVLLSNNPLEDLNHLKNNEGVMVRGKWLSREDIDKKLLTIRDRHQ
ncbi:amidohydrolase family protein [Fulvivirgaceae bacterium BMA12]|uniref:Amidohydrolase family protein n=1 Tax=Agaribacillus aureus TaxID=3051825 RepID=A0ABT8LGU4_9BACT|nr:amidohydrolase family protein [Fulvivirgaceae bacterium BMA12]